MVNAIVDPQGVMGQGENGLRREDVPSGNLSGRDGHLNPSFRVRVKIFHDYSLFHFLIGCYGTTFVYNFLNRHTRVKTYPQGRINFLLPWLWPSAFSYMYHITIFTVLFVLLPYNLYLV
jgi:hypothetical protein